ncbi:hypothetical protein CN383_00440 [Priestia megaterium]|nr:hypothetical protein CN383_00440 [Priestia megaterium]
MIFFVFEGYLLPIKIERRDTYMRRLVPVFILLLLAPALGELLLGDIPFSFQLIPIFLLDMALYGAGAILIRETVRRRDLGWTGILLLGTAYGLAEEGLATQSLFNPHFPGVELGTYGSLFGVNWVWSLYVLGLHIIWSISIPILLTELLFFNQRKDTWLRLPGMCITGFIYIFSLVIVAIMYVNLTNFSASLMLICCTLLLIIGIILLTLRLHVLPADTLLNRNIRGVPSKWTIGIISFFAGAIFFGVHEIFPSVFMIPASVPVLIDLVLFVVVILLSRCWLSQHNQWKDSHSLAFVSGSILNTLLFGFFVAAGNTMNVIFHAILCVITIGLLVIFNWKLHKRNIYYKNVEMESNITID